MNADERRCGVKITHDDGDGVLRWRAVVAGGAETENAEVSPAGGEVGVGELFYFLKRHMSILEMPQTTVRSQAGRLE